MFNTGNCSVPLVASIDGNGNNGNGFGDGGWAWWIIILLIFGWGGNGFGFGGNGGDVFLYQPLHATKLADPLFSLA